MFLLPSPSPYMDVLRMQRLTRQNGALTKSGDGHYNNGSKFTDEFPFGSALGFITDAGPITVPDSHQMFCFVQPNHTQSVCDYFVRYLSITMHLYIVYVLAISYTIIYISYSASELISPHVLVCRQVLIIISLKSILDSVPY